MTLPYCPLRLPVGLPVAFLFCTSFLKTLQSVNITLVTISMGDSGRNGFLVANPAYDVLIDLVKESDPVIFANFTHIFLRYQNNSLSEKGLVFQQSQNSDCYIGTQHITEMLAEFYFTHQELFEGSLDRQFTILNTDGKREPQL